MFPHHIGPGLYDAKTANESNSKRSITRESKVKRQLHEACKEGMLTNLHGSKRRYGREPKPSTIDYYDKLVMLWGLRLDHTFKAIHQCIEIVVKIMYGISVTHNQRQGDKREGQENR